MEGAHPDARRAVDRAAARQFVDQFAVLRDHDGEPGQPTPRAAGRDGQRLRRPDIQANAVPGDARQQREDRGVRADGVRARRARRVRAGISSEDP